MICLNCGKTVNVVSRDCPYCHSPINMNTVTNPDTVKENGNDYDAPNNKLLLLSVFIPIIGFIYYFKNRSDSPLKASSGMGGALIGCLLYMIFIFILLIGKLL